MVGVVESAEGRVEFAALKLRRRDKLADGQFISLQDRDEAAAEKRLAEAELVQARENQQVAAFEQTRAGEQLRLRTIKSPLTGVVTDRLVHPGDLADNRDIRKPLLRVADISVLHVEALLPVAAYGRIAVGATLEVLLDPPGGGRYPAKVRTIDPLIDLASGTFRVRLALPNPDFKFPAGLTCRVEVPTVERGAGSLAATRSRAAHAP
jgi:RND family efflux transporter MFP subunit